MIPIGSYGYAAGTEAKLQFEGLSEASDDQVITDYEAESSDTITTDGEGTGKKLQLGYAVIGEGVNNTNGSAATVYFGSQGYPLAWRVIGYKGKSSPQ